MKRAVFLFVILLCTAGVTKAGNEAMDNNIAAINKLKEAIDKKYSYRDLRNVDWERLFDRYEPSMKGAKTSEEFAEVASKMLITSKDMHLWVKVDGKTVGGFKRNIKRNYNIDLLKKIVPNYRDESKYVSSGRVDKNTGYILIKGWQADREQVIEPALKVLKEFSDLPALIVDVRPNGGGAEPLAGEFAGCFTDKSVLYAKHVYRANNGDGWGPIQKRTLKPNKNMPTYKGKVAVLMGQANMSSCEAFLLMMKQIPNCKLIGERSYGSSGNPKPYDLGNGVTVWLPSWKCLRPDGTCFETEGIDPDIIVRTNVKQLRKDVVLEAGIRYLRSNKSEAME